jgi:hypothetical protein
MSVSDALLNTKNILLALDGSEYSEGAVREALKFAKVTGGSLYILSVAEVTLGQLTHSPDVVETIERETLEVLSKAKERAEKEGINCETIFHKGEEPYQFIVEEASGKNVDVIIMGRRGRRGLKKLMMGSVTALVIGHSPCSVFVVPRAGELKFKRLLIATDGSEYSEKAISAAVALAKKHGSNIVAISVAHKEEEIPEAENNVKKVKEICHKEGIKIEAITVTGTPYEAIVTTAQIKKADLIVIGTHGRTGLTKLLMGSVAERVIALAQCSVLVAK